MNIEITKEIFLNILKGVTQTFSTKGTDIPSEDDLINFAFTENNKLSIKELSLLRNSTSIYFEAIINRVCGIHLLMEDFENPPDNATYKANLFDFWPLIYKSLMNTEPDNLLATIGSQGFLSIPLYHFDSDSFDFLRLHIWDKSLDDYIDKEKTEKFSIHCHQFHAQSRILFGNLRNRLFTVNKCYSATEHSFFKIKWNNFEDVNQKTSSAINTGTFVEVKLTDEELHGAEGTYEVKAGDFHQSKVESQQMVATLFLFSSKKGKVAESFVVGPSNINESTINRKVTIDPRPLLETLNQLINHEGTNQKANS